MSKVSIYPNLPEDMDSRLRESLMDIFRSHAIQINRISYEVTWVSAAQTVAMPIVLADASGGDLALTLPLTKDWDNNSMRIKKMDASVNVVKIGTSGSETIDGATTRTLSTQYSVVEVVSDGAQWVLI